MGTETESSKLIGFWPVAMSPFHQTPFSWLLTSCANDSAFFRRFFSNSKFTWSSSYSSTASTDTVCKNKTRSGKDQNKKKVLLDVPLVPQTLEWRYNLAVHLHMQSALQYLSCLLWTALYVHNYLLNRVIVLSSRLKISSNRDHIAQIEFASLGVRDQRLKRALLKVTMLFWRHQYLRACLVWVRLDVSLYNRDLKEPQEESRAILCCLYLNCAHKSKAKTFPTRSS